MCKLHQHLNDANGTKKAQINGVNGAKIQTQLLFHGSEKEKGQQILQGVKSLDFCSSYSDSQAASCTKNTKQKKKRICHNIWLRIFHCIIKTFRMWSSSLKFKLIHKALEKLNTSGTLTMKIIDIKKKLKLESISHPYVLMVKKINKTYK